MNTINDSVTLINDGCQHTLRELIVSGDITNKSILNIFDADQRFICRGYWYEDKILKYGEEPCKSRKAGTGRSITVILLNTRKKDEKRITNRERLLRELTLLDDEHLYAVLSPELREKALDFAMCDWCKAKHGGECPEAGAKDLTCSPAAGWWSADWNGKTILDMEAKA